MATSTQPAGQPQAQPTWLNIIMAGTLEDTIGMEFASAVAKEIAKAVFPNTAVLVRREGQQVVARKTIFGIPSSILVAICCTEPFNYTAKLKGADETAVNKAYTAIGRVTVGAYDRYHVAVT